jgi:hypothetical protein
MELASWRSLVEPAQAVYSRTNGGAGCCLHVVLDDENIEQGHVEWSLNLAKEQGHPECIRAAEMLLAASQTQRKRLTQNYSLYYRGTPPKPSEVSDRS